MALPGVAQGGIAALPPRTMPGRAPTVIPAWKAELLRVIDLAPRTVGVRGANGMPSLLATYLAAKTHVGSLPRRYAYISTPLAESASGRPGPSNAKPKRNQATWETPADGGDLGWGWHTDTSTRDRPDRL
jgi:hypothetical protein